MDVGAPEDLIDLDIAVKLSALLHLRAGRRPFEGKHPKLAHGRDGFNPPWDPKELDAFICIENSLS